MAEYDTFETSHHDAGLVDADNSGPSHTRARRTRIAVLFASFMLVAGLCVVTGAQVLGIDLSQVLNFNKSKNKAGTHGQDTNTNECRGEGDGNKCDKQAVCVDFGGGYHGYECICQEGWTGNGEWCSEVCDPPKANVITSGILITWENSMLEDQVHITDDTYSYSRFLDVSTGRNEVEWVPAASGMYKFKMQIKKAGGEWSSWSSWTDRVKWTKHRVGKVGELSYGQEFVEGSAYAAGAGTIREFLQKTGQLP